MLLRGIIPPITTPFYPDGRVYLKKLEHNVERYSKTPVAGIVVLGSTGEAIMLSDEERREVLRAAREACASHKVLIAGTGAESALETLRLTEYAADLGYDVALVRTPHFYRPQMKPANLLAFYRTVADGSAIPVLIYSVPAFTNYDMPPELVIELAEHPNIIGIKESGGDALKIRQIVEGTRHIKRRATVTETFMAVTPRMLKSAETSSSNEHAELLTIGALSGATSDHVGTGAPTQPALSDRPNGGSRMGPAAQVYRAAAADSATNPKPLESLPSSSGITLVSGVKTRQKEVGFQVLAGAAQRLLPSLEVGAVGAVLAFASPAPTACYEIYAAWKEGDQELARVKQDRIARPSTRVGAELGVAALKYAADLNGYYGGPPRLPFLPLTADQKAEVEQLMSDIRN
jgi:4-hydroxy-2-oxoglutarate aldolase